MAGITGPGDAPEPQAESSNLSYQPDEGSLHGDDAHSSLSLSFHTEECSVELAELVTVTDRGPADHSPSPRVEDADISLQDFLTELTLADLKVDPAPASPDKSHTRKSEFRNRFASQRPSAAQNLKLKLKLNPDGPRSSMADASAASSSRESPTTPHFVPASPRQGRETPATPRSDRHQSTSHRSRVTTAHSGSESLDSIPEGSGHAKPPRPGARRELDKTSTRRVIPRMTPRLPPTTTVSTPRRPMNTGDDIDGFEDNWEELDLLADRLLTLTIPAPTAADPEPQTPSAEETSPVSEKPPADN